jgi:hypothetical protein
MRNASLSGTALLATVVALLLLITGGTVKPSLASSRSRPLTTPAWAQPLSGVKPYYVERSYGTSRGLTCDLSVYTTNRAALDGTASLRPGDTTATVCVVRRVGG